jgi:hypothetical protein
MTAATHIRIGHHRSSVVRRAIVAGAAVLAAMLATSWSAEAQIPMPTGSTKSMTLTSSTAVPTVGESVLTVSFDNGQTPSGGFFDIWGCPTTDLAPVADNNEGDCFVILFWTRTGAVNTQADATTRAVKANVLTMSWLIDLEQSPAYFAYPTDPYTLAVPGIKDNFGEDFCDVEGTYVIIHDFGGGNHSNFVGPLRIPGCTPETPKVVSTRHPMDLVCTPDPVVPGGTVTCEITQGDPGIDILWRASYNPVFAEQGVTLDEDGRRTFTFVAPRTAQGEVIAVELVEWLPTAAVQVTEQVLPTRLPAGEGSGALPLSLALGGLVLTGAAVLRLRRAGAVS